MHKSWPASHQSAAETTARSVDNDDDGGEEGDVVLDDGAGASAYCREDSEALRGSTKG